MVLQITPETTQRPARNCPQSNPRISDLRTSSRTLQMGTNGNEQNNNITENLPSHFLHLDHPGQRVLSIPGANARNGQTLSDADIVRSQRIADFREAGLELRTIADDSWDGCKRHITMETGRELRRIADEIHGNNMAKDEPPDPPNIQCRGRPVLKRKNS